MNAAKLVVPAAAALLLLNFAVKEARGGDFVVLKEGTPVVVKLTEDFGGAALKEGAKAPLAVAEKVTREGFTLIDAGAPVAATFVPDKGRIEGGGLLISSAEAVDGQDVMLRLTPEVPEGVEADAAGQFPLYIPAGNRRMTEGTTFRVYLSESYFIEE